MLHTSKISRHYNSSKRNLIAPHLNIKTSAVSGRALVSFN